MFVKYFIAGFIIKIVSGFDDSFTRIPIISSLTKTRLGKFAFSVGNFLAVIMGILIAYSFSQIIHEFEYSNVIASGIILFFALVIGFDVFKSAEKVETEKTLQKIEVVKKKRMIALVFVGFITSFVTLLDDIILFVPLFVDGWKLFVYSSIGILSATLVQIIMVIYFAEAIEKIPYKRQIIVLSLIIFAILIYFKIL